MAATPLVAEAAAANLIGKDPTEENFAAAGELAKQITPISDMRGTDEYRMHLVGVLVKRTLTTAVERAQAHSPITSNHKAPRYITVPLHSIKEVIVSASKKAHVTTTINGESTDFLCEPRHSLLEVLRDNLGLTGSKEGCNNETARALSCLMV